MTGSGLGCSDWPTCEQNRLVAPLEFHPMVEFVNRTITGLVSLAVILAVLGSLLRVPRRVDLVRWSLGLVAGVIGQIVWGGITVKNELRPPFVIGHFLLSVVLVADAVVLHHRAGEPDGEPRTRRLTVAPSVRALATVCVALAAVVLGTGTIVTGAGPHGGDERAERLDLLVSDVVRVHSASVWLLLGATVITLWCAYRGGAPAGVRRRGGWLAAAIVVQAVIGYTQYALGVPAGLVALHVLGATLVWIAVLWFTLGLSQITVADTADASTPVGVGA